MSIKCCAWDSKTLLRRKWYRRKKGGHLLLFVLYNSLWQKNALELPKRLFWAIRPKKVILDVNFTANWICVLLLFREISSFLNFTQQKIKENCWGKTWMCVCVRLYVVCAENLFQSRKFEIEKVFLIQIDKNKVLEAMIKYALNLTFYRQVPNYIFSLKLHILASELWFHNQ